MIRSLPRKNGFAQRTFTETEPTLYLAPLIEGVFPYWRSPVTLPLIRRDVTQFTTVEIKDPDPLMKLAISRTRDAFKLNHKVKMLHLNDVFSTKLNIWHSSPGLPWRDIGYKTKDDIRTDPDAVHRVRWFWHRVKHGDKIYPPDCCAFVRSHVAERGEYKVRAVWGYPATITFGEAMFAVPLIHSYANNPNIAYGYETALGGCCRVRRRFGKYSNHTALDFSSFDKTVPAYLIDVAFDILADNIDFVHYEQHGVADARRSIRVFDYIRDYFINTPIRLSDGSRYKKSSGVASGSYFTQLIDSIVNYMLIQYACLKQHGQGPQDLLVLGDDSIFSTKLPFSLDDAQDAFAKYGMFLNVKKSCTSKQLSNLSFLGYELNEGIPTKPHDRWLAALIFPERPDKCWNDVASRAMGLLYANFGVDDRFDSLCRWLIHLRPYELQLSRNMERMLRAVGITINDPSPPDKRKLMRQLAFF